MVLNETKFCRSGNWLNFADLAKWKWKDSFTNLQITCWWPKSDYISSKSGTAEMFKKNNRNRLETGLLYDATWMPSDFTMYEKNQFDLPVFISALRIFYQQYEIFPFKKCSELLLTKAIKFHEMQKTTISLTYFYQITALWVRKLRIFYH